MLGQTVVVQRKFDAEDWLRLVDKYKVTSTFSAPTPIRMICSLPADVKARYDRSSMRRMIANAAPWCFALKQMYLADFPDRLAVGGLRLDRAGRELRPRARPTSCASPARAARRRPASRSSCSTTTATRSRASGPDAAGRALRALGRRCSPTTTSSTTSTRGRQRGGYQTVGDIAYRDDEGYFYICDRKKDMIISGGMNIYPAEIEAALESHPDIYDAAVFGIPSDEWGESVHAVVVARPGSRADAPTT